VRNGTTLIKAKLHVTKCLEDTPIRPSIPWYNLKIIPSVKKDARPDFMQLTSVPSNPKLKELHEGYAELEFASSSADPLGKVKVEKIMRSQFWFFDGVLKHVEVVYDYLTKQPK
jgi:acetoacetate decarboxylase